MNKNKIIAFIVGTTMISGIISTANLNEKNIYSKINSKNEVILAQQKKNSNDIIYNINSTQEFISAVTEINNNPSMPAIINLTNNISVPNTVINTNSSLTLNGNGHTLNILGINTGGASNNYNVIFNNISINWSPEAIISTNNLIFRGNVNFINSNFKEFVYNNAIVTYKSSINSTIESNFGLHYEGNIELLQNAINGAKAININGYTSKSVESLQGAISGAQQVLNNLYPSESMIEAAIAILQSKEKGLVVDKSGLQNEINTAKVMNIDGYTPDSVKALQNAITAGESIISNKDATVQDVTTAITNLQNAIKGLNINKEGLESAISNAKEVLALPKKLSAPEFTAETVNILQNLINQGEDALKESDASQIEILTNKIIDATNNLVVNIPDKNFNILLYSSINKKNGNGPVTYGQLQKLKSISTLGYTVSAFSINSIDGLQYCPNVIYFQGGNNNTHINNLDLLKYISPKAIVSIAAEFYYGNTINSYLDSSQSYTTDSLNNLKDIWNSNSNTLDSLKDISVNTFLNSYNQVKNAVKGLVKETVNVESNIKTAYFEPYGLVINANLSGIKFSRNTPKYLVFLNDNGSETVVKGVNVNWYSKDSTDFSGAQFIVTPSILKELNGTLNAHLYLVYEHNGIMERSLLSGTQNIKGEAFDIPFNLVSNNDQAVIEGIYNSELGVSRVKVQYTEPYGLVVNTVNNFENQNLTKNDKIQLVVKNSKGDIVNKFKGVNVDWYSFGNYSGAQFIISNNILNQLKAMEKNGEKLNFEVSYNNIVNTLSLNVG
ncbi:MAG: FIVAR domain-containing protein [Sarcina sp.]